VAHRAGRQRCERVTAYRAQSCLGRDSRSAFAVHGLLLASRVTSVDALAPRLSWHVGLVEEDHLAFASLDRRAADVLFVEDLHGTDHTGRAGSHVLSTHRTGRNLVPHATKRRPGAAVSSLHRWRRVRVQRRHQPAGGVEHETLSVVDGTIVSGHPAAVDPPSPAGQGPKTLGDLRPYTPTGRFRFDEVPRDWKEAP
jgi:hypothetical protein